MDNIFYGATKEQAILNAEKKLNISRKYFIIEILEEPNNKTIFNILDQKNVKIAVTIDEEKMELIKKLTKLRDKKKKNLNDSDLEMNKNAIEDFFKAFSSFNLSVKIDYDIKEEDKDFYINLKTSNDSIIIGNKGSTINAIQTYLQQVLISKFKNAANVFVDAANYREKRSEIILTQAEEAAFKVRKDRSSIALEPMSSFERKQVHDIMLKYPDLTTQSEGTEPNRHIVISKVEIE